MKFLTIIAGEQDKELFTDLNKVAQKHGWEYASTLVAPYRYEVQYSKIDRSTDRSTKKRRKKK